MVLHFVKQGGGVFCVGHKLNAQLSENWKQKLGKKSSKILKTLLNYRVQKQK